MITKESIDLFTPALVHRFSCKRATISHPSPPHREISRRFRANPTTDASRNMGVGVWTPVPSWLRQCYSAIGLLTQSNSFSSCLDLTVNGNRYYSITLQ